MIKGTVRFHAKIRGDGLTFPSFEFNPNETGVEKIEIEGNYRDEIRTAVHLLAAASHAAGQALATKVNTAILNRIAFKYDIVIESGRMTGAQFDSADSQPGVDVIEIQDIIYSNDSLQTDVGVEASYLKAELEQVTLSGEHNYGLFRSARQSESPVEEFMHLYNILLMILGGNQQAVDAFILKEEPTVPRTQSPIRPPSIETVYTRLRNEFGHRRIGANMENTKSEMAARLNGLKCLSG